MFSNAQNQQQKQGYEGIKSALHNIQNAQNFQPLQHLISIHQLCHTQQIAQLNQQLPTPTRVTPQEYESFRRRCDQVAAKNHKLKKQILQLKHHLRQQLNLYTGDDSENLEQTRVIQKIKLIGTDIKAKILTLKQKQHMILEVATQNQLRASNVQRSLQKIIPANLKVQEIKKGAEYLFKELIHIKYDMEATEKFIKSNPGEERRFDQNKGSF